MLSGAPEPQDPCEFFDNVDQENRTGPNSFKHWWLAPPEAHPVKAYVQQSGYTVPPQQHREEIRGFLQSACSLVQWLEAATDINTEEAAWLAEYSNHILRVLREKTLKPVQHEWQTAE
jgi:hypothetical protein